MTHFIDTNIFLRYFVDEGEPSHKECVELIKRIQNKKIKATTSHLVLTEIAWTLKSYYKTKKNNILSILNSIETMSITFTNKFQTSLAHSLFKNSTAKYVDCLIASIPEVNSKKWTVVSYDRDFDMLGINCKSPPEIQ